MALTRCLLNGHPIAGAFRWAKTAGVRPFQTIVHMSHSHADALVGARMGPGGVTTGTTGGENVNRPVTLVIEPTIWGRFAGKRTRTVEGVYVLHRVPSPSPKFAAVAIADRRWLWTNSLYRRSLNVSRKSGSKRMTSPNQLGAFDVEPKLAYAPWSLIGGTTLWKATDLLSDLADAIKRYERTETGVEPEVILPNIPNDSPAQLPIQDLELDGELDAAIERALAYLPGYSVTITDSGAVKFYSTSDASEAAQIEKAGLEVQGRGHLEGIDYSRIRPRRIRFFFNVEAELGIRAAELASTGATTDVQPGSDFLMAENVLPVPDPVLPGTTKATGTWVTMAEAFTAWGAVPGLGASLDFPVVREAFVPFQNLWNVLRDHGAVDPHADWASRIGAVQTHYRQTYRLNPAWMDRISDIRAYRVATINPETGTRGAASVFSDFAYVPTMRSLLAESLNNGTVGYVLNVANYPSGGVITSDTIAAPASVRIEDSEQGVFSVSYNADPFRLYEIALPSQVELRGANTQPGNLVAAGQGGPSPFLGRSNRPLGFNLLGRFDQPPQLTANHAIIVILTATPGSPNGKAALAYVDVTPAQVPGFPGQDKCLGPALEVRIGPALATARSAWDDNQKDRIQSFFTTKSAPDTTEQEYPLRDLIVNYSASAAGAVSLESIAKAGAARIYHAMRDRPVGSAAFNFGPELEVAGTISAVTDEVSSTGVVTTSIDLPGRVEPLSLDRYLDDTARRLKNRIINPGK